MDHAEKTRFAPVSTYTSACHYYPPLLPSLARMADSTQPTRIKLMAYWQAQYVFPPHMLSFISSHVVRLVLDSRYTSDLLQMIGAGAFLLYVQSVHELTHTVPSVLAVYDPLITHAQERKLVWQRKISIASLIFIANRYITIVENAALVVQMMHAHYYGSQLVSRSQVVHAPILKS